MLCTKSISQFKAALLCVLFAQSALHCIKNKKQCTSKNARHYRHLHFYTCLFVWLKGAICCLFTRSSIPAATNANVNVSHLTNFINWLLLCNSVTLTDLAFTVCMFNVVAYCVCVCVCSFKNNHFCGVDCSVQCTKVHSELRDVDTNTD